MGTLILRYLKDRRVSTIVYCIATIALLWMYIAMYPTIQQQSATFTEAFKNYPEAVMKAMGIEMMDFSHLENFLAMEQFSIVWPIMVIFLVTAFASNALSREVEKGTMEIVLSRPVSRLKLFMSRYIAGIAVLIIFTLASTLMVAPLAAIHNLDYQFGNYLKTALVGFLFAWAVFSFAMLFSAIFSEKSKVAMVAGGTFIGMYVLKIVASLIERFEWLKYVSFFHYFDANETLIRGNVEVLPIVIFAVVALVCTVIGVVLFQKRDIAV
ncbi:MAG: ABC transporter permease subunit [Patescibacteria group bacterium]|nr:ABC transporter permease subunit [Patescibacteria group bacterium]MDD5715394.1 ABC transporter permease subunit [Patescibacteria group bacterium]